MRILLPVDGSDASVRVIEHMIRRRGFYAEPDKIELHLLNVQHGLPRHVGRMVDSADLDDYHREEGLKCMAPARAALDAAGVPYTYHIGVGEPPEVIIRYVEKLGCEQIRMGIHNRGFVADFFMGSVSSGVLKLTKVPVLLVP